MAHVPAGAYTAAIVRRMLWRLWWLPLLPLAWALWWAHADWRMSVLGLMLALIVMPMLASLAIMRHAASPVLARRCRANKFVAEGTRLHLYHVDEESGITTHIESVDIACIDYGRHHDTVITGRRMGDFVLIPAGILG